MMAKEDWEICAKYAKDLFDFGQRVALERGLILVDTKYEFGKGPDGTIYLIDEVHTPDSSRYWIADTFEAKMAAGKNPDNIDKEFLRVWFTNNCDPYKDEVLPPAPTELVCELSRRYVMLYEMITGETFQFPEPKDVEARVTENVVGFFKTAAQ
jgi:phosphoribosylaminoimidazole-succinocarboxamide synthase